MPPSVPPPSRQNQGIGVGESGGGSGGGGGGRGGGGGAGGGEGRRAADVDVEDSGDVARNIAGLFLRLLPLLFFFVVFELSLPAPMPVVRASVFSAAGAREPREPCFVSRVGLLETVTIPNVFGFVAGRMEESHGQRKTKNKKQTERDVGRNDNFNLHYISCTTPLCFLRFVYYQYYVFSPAFVARRALRLLYTYLPSIS